MRLRDEPQILAALADLDAKGLERFHQSLLQDLADIGHWGASEGAPPRFGHEVATQSILRNLRELVPAYHQSTLPTKTITIHTPTADDARQTTRVALQNWDNNTEPQGLTPARSREIAALIIEGDGDGFTTDTSGTEVHWEVVA